MNKIIALMMAAALMLCAVASAEAATLTVRGTGVVSLDPDTVVITLGVRESAPDVSDVQVAVNTKLNSVIEKFRELGIGDDDIHTNSIFLTQNYDYSRSDEQLIGYIAENTVAVTTRDIENVGKYIDEAFEAGANYFSDISFSASETEGAMNQALRLSVENAREKAEVLAEAAGMKLDGVISISEEPYSYGYENAKFAIAESDVDTGSGTPVMSSKIQVSASVTVEYTLSPVE